MASGRRPTRCWCACTSRCPSWTCWKPALAAVQASAAGVAVLLNCGEDAAGVLARVQACEPAPPTKGAMDLRTYGVGAQILKALGVHRMRLLGSPRRMPSMTGYGLEVTGFAAPPNC